MQRCPLAWVMRMPVETYENDVVLIVNAVDLVVLLISRRGLSFFFMVCML